MDWDAERFMYLFRVNSQQVADAINVHRSTVNGPMNNRWATEPYQSALRIYFESLRRKDR